MSLVIDIDLSRQLLTLKEEEPAGEQGGQGARVLYETAVSSARNGAGEQSGSECTPRGWHRIRAKIGGALPRGAVFVGRRFTGEVYDAQLAEQYPQRDWVLTRILWLSGLEVGKNRFGSVDTMRRYIYIHGCPDEVPMGVAQSHGCIRMRNDELIELFERVESGTRVYIHQ
ncbi:MAG: L,D-transpeptidase [Gammaproteobacteria bacterium]|nr:L,D-transpeptidase [Gammaproteobacteria bacterium]